MSQCSEHRAYRAIRQPVSTEKHPGGCPACWGMYRDEHAPRPYTEAEKLDRAKARGGKPSVADLVSETDRLQEYRAKTQIKALREQAASMEREIEKLRRALDISEDLRAAPRVQPVTRREKTSGLREACPFIMISDTHVGETVRSEAVNGLNAYNPKICRERFGRLREAIRWEIELERHAFKMRDVFLWLGGDLITGTIHEELLESNSMSTTQEVLFAQEMCEAQIDDLLAQDFERIIIPTSHGNHGRNTPKRRISTGALNSYEWLLYKSLERRYADEKRIQFLVADGALNYVKAYNTSLRLTHGDDIMYGGGVGGITIPILKKIAQWDKSRRADETVMGHWHQRLTHRGLNVNGSLMGYSPYALSIGASPEPPEQGFFLLDSVYGKVHPKSLVVTPARSR